MGKSNLVRFDWAAKRLLRNKSNFVVLEGFLSVLLEDEIHIERILESEGNRSLMINLTGLTCLLKIRKASWLL